MQDQAPSEELARLLSEFENSGGVVDFAIFQPPQREVVSLAHHQEAAIGTLRAVEKKRRDWQKRGGIEPKHEFHFKIDASKMTAKQIGVREFLGPRCELDLKTLRFAKSSTSDTWTGFAYAFSAPPYSMPSQSRCQELFTTINDLLFGQLSKLDITEWSTDWSNYFEPGREWWGSFCWTVYTPHKKQLVGIAASTTD